MPKKWVLEIEEEANQEMYGPHYDPPIHDELARLEDEPEELADIDLATELLMTPLPHAESLECAEKCSNMQLSPVPASVDRQLEAYKAFRQCEFNRHREGTQVVSTTVDGDSANALRWLGYVKQQYKQVPSLCLFANEHVGEWTQSWLEKLRSLGLKASTLAVYTNGVISVAGFALTLVENADACPITELINLRRTPCLPLDVTVTTC